ncbi:MAG: type II toxin-antitoxin system HicB family antitoxin [Chloroflexi bacterium]|nr:type II toxin-antitoxin system HicB family antitoxin [Chloroflexota bacterium]
MLRLLTWNEYVRLVLSYAVFSHNEDGSWTVEIPVLPGCVTWGETRAEAAVMAEDAVQGWLMTRDIPVGTLAAIIKEAGLTVEEWLAL